MRRTKEDAEQTRMAILEAALIVFAEMGFDGTNLDEIAQKANVSRGAIYWHFKDKFGLFIQLLESAFDSYRIILQDAMQNELAPIDKIRDMISSILSRVQHTQSLSRMFIMEMTFRINNREYENQIQAVVTDFVSFIDKHLTDIILAGQRAGEIRTDIEASDITFTIKSYMKGITHQPRQYLEENFNPDKSIRYTDVIIRGISTLKI